VLGRLPRRTTLAVSPRPPLSADRAVPRSQCTGL